MICCSFNISFSPCFGPKILETNKMLYKDVINFASKNHPKFISVAAIYIFQLS